MNIRDTVEGLVRTDLHRNGIVPGRRGNSNDPATYQSDLVERRWDHILGDQDALADVLAEHLPMPVAEFLAYVAIHWPSHKGYRAEPFSTLAQRSDVAISELVWAHCMKEAGP